MNKNLKIILYGFLVWLVPFIVSFFIYPLKTAGNPLFESIMPLVITLMVVTLSYQYLKTLKTDLIREGIIIGIVWFVINIAIDMVLFLPASPMHMSLTSYMGDIGVTYIMIPMITIGMGYMAVNKSQ